jgi:small subunit ribosomal protein S9
VGDQESLNPTPEMTPESPSAGAPEPQPALATPPPPPGPGPYYGTGRRKTSVARVYVRTGGGQIRINGRKLDEFFASPLWRQHAREPLAFVGVADQYDADIRVTGGGSAGQAGAVRLGLARALALANPELKSKLRRGGFLTRDPRMKERKKYGQKGARKRFQWTKR